MLAGGCGWRCAVLRCDVWSFKQKCWQVGGAGAASAVLCCCVQIAIEGLTNLHTSSLSNLQVAYLERLNGTLLGGVAVSRSPVPATSKQL